MESLQIDISEPQLLKDIQQVFNTENISVNDAITMFFRWVQHENALPHTVAMFNQTTQKAIADSYAKRNVVKCENAQDMFNKLGI